ncbi:MAG: phosphoribosylformylglycinamidine synthase subunit PurQ [Candidatus Methanofastidiosia archaeon]
MKPEDINICILRIEGTNNEQEMYDAFKRLGTKPHLVHLNELSSLKPYQCLMIPGGFSAGDYIRAGTIFASRIKSTFMDELNSFIKEGYAVGGICNGFQILVELGLLPGNPKGNGAVTACLSRNDSARFECRHSILKHVSSNKCVFTSLLPQNEQLIVPSAHAEGKFLLSSGKKAYEKLEKNGQIIFKYVNYNGETNAPYPWNPNGSPYNIAGICNKRGNVFGMMPHPERSFFSKNEHGYSGKILFESVVKYIGGTF